MSTQANVESILAERREHNGKLATARAGRGSKKSLLVLLTALVILPLLQVGGLNLNYVLHMALYTFMYIAMASSWNILGGYTGYISLGHNLFFCIGGYFSGMLLARYGISSLLTAPVAGLVAMAAGFCIGFITLRVRGPSFIISSIALLMMAKILFDNWDFVGGSNGISLPQMDLPVEYVKIPYYYAMLLIAVVTLMTSYAIRHSKIGLGLRAISQDEIKAECAGIDTRFLKILAFSISAFFVGMAGAVWAEYLTYMRPNIFLIILVAANMVLMCILGGKGTVAGPVVGAVLLIAFNEFFVSQFGASEINILGTGLVMLLALIFFPNGLVGTLRKMGKLPRILDWD
ncbi:MAG: branched-chain amino acid ABC transporter permease [Rhodospirillales bacterium]|nr:branched-chain amino acid ABC transporter permease [Rhodospirillales bacterium]